MRKIKYLFLILILVCSLFSFNSFAIDENPQSVQQTEEQTNQEEQKIDNNNIENTIDNNNSEISENLEKDIDKSKSNNNETLNDSQESDEKELRIEEPTKGYIPKVDEVTDGDDDVFIVNRKYMTIMADSATYHMEKTDSGGIQVGYRFIVTSGTGKGAIGTCVDPWGSIGDETVTGTVYKISNSTRTARLAYYIFKQGWDPGDAATYNGVWRGMAIHRSLATARVDDKIYTSKTREELWDKFYSMGANSKSYEAAMDLYSTALNTYSASAVPNNFEVFFLDTPGDRQDSISWRQAPEGSLKISKTVQEGDTNPTFTFDITVAGANGTFSGIVFSNGNATITLKHGQSKTINGLPASASYSVSERSLIGWQLAGSSGTSGKIPGGGTATASFTNKIKYIDITINKGTTNADVTNGNPLYNVAGTTFALYRTQADARNGSNVVTTFTIGSSGKSETRSVQEGYYYLVETKAATGYLIPDSLKASAGGVYIDGTHSQTINV